MVCVALLSNPKSTGNRQTLPRVRSYCASNPDIFHYEVEHVDQIGRAFQTIARVDPAVIVINGGDGTLAYALTEILEHRVFDDRVPHIAVLRGGMSAKDRKAAQAALSVADDEERLILATGRYIGEGFDDARLDTLFLTMPIAWKGTLAQYVGRLHRRHDDKKEVLVVDYVDSSVPVLARMAAKRRTGYRALGYVME